MNQISKWTIHFNRKYITIQIFRFFSCIIHELYWNSLERATSRSKNSFLQSIPESLENFNTAQFKKTLRTSLIFVMIGRWEMFGRWIERNDISEANSGYRNQSKVYFIKNCFAFSINITRQQTWHNNQDDKAKHNK